MSADVDMLHYIHGPVAARRGRPGKLAVRRRKRHVLACGPDRNRRHGICANRLVECFARLYRNTGREVQSLHGQLVLLLGHQAARKPAGIADVVDDPDLHVALLGLFGELLEEGEVLGRQVGRGHAAAGLRRDRMKAEALCGVQVMRQALDGHSAIQSEVGLRPVLRRRGLPCLLDFGRGRHLNLLPGILLAGRLREARLREQNRYACSQYGYTYGDCGPDRGRAAIPVVLCGHK